MPLQSIPILNRTEGLICCLHNNPASSQFNLFLMSDKLLQELCILNVIHWKLSDSWTWSKDKKTASFKVSCLKTIPDWSWLTNLIWRIRRKPVIYFLGLIFHIHEAAQTLQFYTNQATTFLRSKTEGWCFLTLIRWPSIFEAECETMKACVLDY